jgi:multidrug efflux pump
MTTMAAACGALPLVLATGTGSELRRPLGVAIVGGLLVQPGLDALHHPGGLSLFRPDEHLVAARAGKSKRAETRRQPAPA